MMVETRARLVAGVQQLGTRGRRTGLSERPVLALLQNGLKGAEGPLWQLPQWVPEYHSFVMAVINRALADSSPPGPVDIDYWHRDPTLFDSLEPALECLRVSAGA